MSYSGPFGDSDGSKTDIKKILDEFIPLDYGHGKGDGRDSEEGRIVIGAKGSGKTIYLRRVQSMVARDGSIYVADQVREEIPITDKVVYFAELFRDRITAPQWQLLWNRAILRSLMSHILWGELGADIADSTKKTLASNYEEFLSITNVPSSVYSQVSEMLDLHASAHKFTTYLDHALWREVEYRLFTLLSKLPPVYFFIDHLDDGFQQAPKHWLHCQRGLFDAVLSLLRYGNPIGRRVHVYVAVRDVVFSSALANEHAGRLLSEHHIRTLYWDFETIGDFLDRKLQRLDREFLLQPSASDPLERWLGTSKITNVKRGIPEDLKAYLLRHTRLLPRDIIIMGNILTRAVRRSKANGEAAVPEETIRDAVSEAARFFGTEQLRICANEIAALSVRREPTLRGYSQVLLESQAYVESVYDSLRKIIRRIGIERFTQKKLDNTRKHIETEMPEMTEAFAVLWKNRLLGYRDKTRDGQTRDVFFSVAEPMDLDLPSGRREYIFHSCLIDSANIKSNGRDPAHGETRRVRQAATS
jgi:hypothetical protein